MNIDLYKSEQPPRRDHLPGGAVMLSVPVPGVHSVTFGVWLRTGSQDEPSDLGGVSHFIEHMVFKGTENRSAFEVAATFDRLGASVDAFTTKDLVAFTVKVLPDYFEPAVDLLAEMLLHPRLDPRLVALEQDVVCEEIQEAFDTPEDRLHDAFAGRLYGSHRRGRPILGRPETVRSFTPELLRREHAKLFTGPNVVVAVAGNIQEGFHERVVELFGGLTGGEDATPAAPDRAPRPTAAASLAPEVEEDPFRLELVSPVVQSYFEIGNLGIPFAHPDRIPVFMLNNLLGGGMSSRIFQAVREREGLAYTIYTYSDMGRDVGLVSCAGSCSPDKLERLEEVIRSEYAALIRHGVPADELDNNRAQIKSQLIFSLEGVLNQMHRAARNELYYGRFVPVAELVDLVDAVDVDTVRRCAGTWYDPESLLVAVHGPEQPADASA